jgi:hypothetical protein
MSTPITKYVQDATLLLLGHPTNGFNASLAVVAGSYSVQPVTINWGVGSMQFFAANLHPDDLDESTPSKYPMVFLHGVQSRNTHESLGRKFSGQVQLQLTFWLTHKAASASKAGPALEALCNAIEETCNNLFYNGNWPQGYGASSAICIPPVCTRAQVEQAGEMWRQAIGFNLVFTLDTN